MSLVALYRHVFGLLGSDRLTAYWLLVANVLLVGATLAEPILFGRVIDVLASLTQKGTEGMWSDLAPLLMAWVSLGLFSILCAGLIALYADRLAHQRRHVVLRDFFEHILQLSAHHRDAQHSGRLMKIMLQGTDALWAIWLGFFRDYFAAFTAILVLMPVAFYLNPYMASLLLLLSLLFAGMTRLVIRKTDQMQRAVERHYSDMAEHMADSLGNVAVIQSFGRIHEEVDTLRKLSGAVINAQFPALSWWALINILTRCATTLTVLAMLCLGLWLFSVGKASIGEIVTFIGFAGLIIGRLEQAVSFANRLAVETPKLREFFEVRQMPSGVVVKAHPTDLPTVRGQVQFKAVDFAYAGTQHPAIRDFTLTIEPGETVALVGPSGAGKSTTLALLCRLFDPQAGEILIDGVDIRDMSLEGLRQHIGIVFQESLLFNRSVADNLRVGNPLASDEQLHEAARQACSLDFIERLPQGFQTVVGERGRYLSGGQRQRLAIARVLLKDPAILVLDEATSALDAQTERIVQQAMTEVQKGRTTLVIAHRLSTIEHADRIVFMDAGQMVESGTFESLMRQGGRFAAMVQTQFALQGDFNG